MISEIYGFPVYKGKFSNPEKVLHYIQECKLEKSDKWNANCLISAENGSTNVGEEENRCINDDIFNEIIKHASEMLKELEINLNVSPSECGKLECKECRDVWVNKYTKGHNQNMHWHVDNERGILFSFAYFAKYNPERDANFVFVNPVPRDVCHKEMLKHPSFSKAVKMDIEEGDILIFPCWMLHYVTTQQCEGPRITMAGNLYEIKSGK
jgi:hypothetical protein